MDDFDSLYVLDDEDEPGEDEWSGDDYDPGDDFAEQLAAALPVQQQEASSQSATPTPSTPTQGSGSSDGTALAPVLSIYRRPLLIGRASLDQLHALLVPLEPETTTASVVAGSDDGHRGVHSALAPEDDDRPGTRLARSAPISEVLVGLGWTLRGQQLYRPDHSGQSGHDATVYPATDVEPEKVTFFGAHAQADFGLSDQDHSWSSWDLLGHVYCAGDWRLAARIAASYQTPDELAELLLAHPTPEALATAVPQASNVDEALASSGQAATTLAAALAAKNGTRFDLGNGIIVVIGGPDHGIRADVQRGRGENAYFVEEQITDWVTYRSLRRKLVRIGRDDRPDEYSVRYELKLIRSDGKVFPSKQMDFGAKESTSIETIDLLDAGVMLPVKADDRQKVANVMRHLGFDDLIDEYVWSSTGWVLLPDGNGGERAVFLAPNGSMTSSGVDPSFVVGPPPHSDEDSLKASQELIGWNGTVDDPASTVKALRAFIDTAPKRPEIPIALLGGIFAAPLRMKNRAAIGLNGAAGSNKSILTAAAFSFYSAHPVSKEALPFNISNGSSVPGAKAQLSWHRDMVLFADDYKKGNTRTEDGKTWDSIMRVLVQSAYDGQSGDMGTQGGGLRSNRASTATLIFSGELILPEAAILQRCVSLQISEGDIDSAGDANAYDTFRDTCGDTGVARSFCGSYLKFLCGEIEAHDGRLGWLGRTTSNDFDDAFQRYLKMQARLLGRTNSESGAIRRAAETAAIISTGWRWARIFAERRGFADQMPSEDEIEAAILKVLMANSHEQAVADYGIRVISTAAEMLAANSGHLLMQDGTRPELDGGSPGWLMTITPTGEQRWDPKGPLLGYISMDYRYVLLVNDALRAIQRAANLDGLETSQLKRSLAKHVVAGTVAGERSPVQMFNRRRGFVLDLERFDLAPGASTTGAQEMATVDEDF